MTAANVPPRDRDWFTDAEMAFLRAARVGRLATVDRHGAPQVKPVSFVVDSNTINIAGHRMEASAKWRNIARDPRVAFVVDDIGEGTYHTVRGIEVRGSAVLVGAGHGLADTRIELRPARVLSWNLH